jgi:hypothetical protein
MVGAGAADGSRLPAIPIAGKNIIVATVIITTALTRYDFFLHMVCTPSVG